MAGWLARRFQRGVGDRGASGQEFNTEPDGEMLADRLAAMPGFRVLRAIDTFQGVEDLRPLQAGERIAAVIDTETTGLDPASEKIVEIAIQRFIFDTEARILEIEQPRSWLEDPQRPLSKTIRAITGITDHDLGGQRFDDDAIARLVESADLMIAHNAAFDRPFFDRRFPRLDGLFWACSLSQLDWHDLGFEGRSLGYLVLQSGRFFEGHRALNDTTALTTLLGTLAPDGRTLLAHLLQRCRERSVRVDAVGAPFDAKAELKDRGYRWNVGRKVWWREVGETEAEAEQAWLDLSIYRGKGRPNLIPLSPRTRFKTNEPA